MNIAVRHDVPELSMCASVENAALIANEIMRVLANRDELFTFVFVQVNFLSHLGTGKNLVRPRS